TLPLQSEILPACDGRSLGPEIRALRYRPHLHRPRYPFALSDSEIACFLSHRAAWQAIVDRNLEAGLIVEDDVATADEDFTTVLTAVTDMAGPNDYVRFPRWERGETGEPVRSSGPATVIEPFLPALGMQMQLVGREAAARLLAATESFDRPVDSTVQMQWLHGARILSARPIVIREIDRELGGTVLQNKTMSLGQKLNHELQRPLMRWAVRHANRRWRAATGHSGAEGIN
ncbi:MAG TPA: glycosyltransferase family 25 protein, partial [Nitrospiraceae bacterium]|nr:glycosyltransferase family 25 protein [Nitrospiraceae bacterium]